VLLTFLLFWHVTKHVGQEMHSDQQLATHYAKCNCVHESEDSSSPKSSRMGYNVPLKPG